MTGIMLLQVGICSRGFGVPGGKLVADVAVVGDLAPSSGFFIWAQASSVGLRPSLFTSSRPRTEIGKLSQFS